jgi:hypothetical protein
MIRVGPQRHGGDPHTKKTKQKRNFMFPVAAHFKFLQSKRCFMSIKFPIFMTSYWSELIPNMEHLLHYSCSVRMRRNLMLSTNRLCSFCKASSKNYLDLLFANRPSCDLMLNTGINLNYLSIQFVPRSKHSLLTTRQATCV